MFLVVCKPVFPFLFGGTFIEGSETEDGYSYQLKFPFLFGGTFIEGDGARFIVSYDADFPSFSEGLSLRVLVVGACGRVFLFPFLFGGTFIEGLPKTLKKPLNFISLPFRRDFH